MSAEKSVLSLIDFSRKDRRPALVGVNAAHQPPMGRADFGLAGAGRKAKDLIGLLLCHAARARRASRPVTSVRVEAVSPAGHPA